MLYLQKTNFSTGVNMYTPKVTSIWYCLSRSQRPRRCGADSFSGCLFLYSMVSAFSTENVFIYNCERTI